MRLRIIWLFLGLLAVLPAGAQVTVGDNLSMRMDGNLGAGYTADYGNAQPSDHGLGLNGNANVNGYYYNPGFFTFTLSPYYNRSQENSGVQSITNASSFNVGTGIFSGSHFPGAISWGKTFDSSGNFGLPGIQGFTTHGDTTQLGIAWSALLPNLPPVSAQYTQSSTSSSVFGTDQRDDSTSRNLNLQSSYRLAGWWMTARFGEFYSRSQIPAFLTGGEANIGDQNSTTFNYNASHRLPLRGSGSFSYTYDAYHGDGGITNMSGSSNNYSGNATFQPWTRLSTSFGMQYNSNLSAVVEQQLASAGSIAPQVNLGTGSHSLMFYNNDTVSILRNLSASFTVNRIEQEVFGTSVAVTHYSGIVNYRIQKPLWGSIMVFGGVNDQSTDAGNQGAGLVAGINFSRMFAGWDVGAGFSYAQEVETVLATSTTSNYSYQASARRRLSRHLQWYSNFSGFHTGLSAVTGSASHSENYSSTILYRSYSIGANLSKSYGTALLTANGLVTTPLTIPIAVLGSNQYLLLNGTSWGVNASASPFRRLTVSGSYARAQSQTTTPTLTSANSSQLLFAYTQYQFRKMSFSGGFTHLMQGVGASGMPPTNFSSYYFGIQRWFKPF